MRVQTRTVRTSDADLRAALVVRLAALPEAGRILHEVTVPLSNERADIVHVNGELAAFELKSARDDLSRLRRQVSGYARVFEAVTIVCDPRHTDEVWHAVPEWCGVIEATWSEDGLAFATARTSRRNPEVDRSCQLRMLWRDELLLAVKATGMNPVPRYHCDLREAVLRAFSDDEISLLVRNKLIARDPKKGHLFR